MKKKRAQLKKKDSRINCCLCNSKYIPTKRQVPAQWAHDWCTHASGLLCPPCHAAAKKLKAVSREELPIGVLPFGSDILEKSESCAFKTWLRCRQNESWKNWVKNNRPEWLKAKNAL